MGNIMVVLWLALDGILCTHGERVGLAGNRHLKRGDFVDADLRSIDSLKSNNFLRHEEESLHSLRRSTHPRRTRAVLNNPCLSLHSPH